MARQTINSGSAPIVWSTVKDAFEKINANFTEIYSTLGGEINPIDFTGLETDLIPDQNSRYDIGSITKRWQQLFLTPQGIVIGEAAIRSDGAIIQLPEGSRIGSKLINDPADVGFGTVRVAGQDDVVADNVTAALTMSTGNGIDITTDSINDTVIISNSGVLDITAGVGVAVSGSQNKTITNAGVTSAVAGLGISVDNSTGPVTIVNEGVVGLEGGTGISIGARNSEGRIVISNSAPATGILLFRDILITGQPSIIAQSVADQLSFVPGNGISLTSIPAGGGFPSRINFINSGVTELSVAGTGLSVTGTTGAISLSFNNRVDIIGSVFADDSTMLVDGTNGIIPASVIQGTFNGNVIGNLSGTVTGNVLGNVTGDVLGNVTGDVLGNVTGDLKGSVVADDSTVIIDGTQGRVLGLIDSPSAILGKITKKISNIDSATGTVVHNCLESQTFYHRSIAGDFVINATNLNLDNNNYVEIFVFLDQSSPAYVPTGFEIGGANQSIKWVDSTVFNAGNINKVDVLTYTVSRYNDNYTVLASYKTFGVGV
jgi:hypothetical protein